MTYLLYARVSPKGSSWDGTETTVPDQLRDARAYIQARYPGATCMEAWDELATADHKAMHAFRRHMEDMRAGRATWDALVARHIDRIGRSALEVIQLGAELQRHGKALIIYAMPFPSEPPMGPLILGIFALLAEFERRMIADRTRAKMTAIAAAGGIPYGRAPLGYRRAGPHNNVPEVDPRKGEAVKDIFTSYAAGTAGPAELARRYGLSIHAVWDTLRRRFYLGEVEYDGRTFPGRHQPIVSQDLWDRVQDRLPERHRGPGRPAPRHNARRQHYPLAGLLRCSCGRYLTPGCAHGRNGVYRYYLCTNRDTCRQRVPADRIEGAGVDLLRSMPIDPASIEDTCRLMTDRIRTQIAASTDTAQLGTLHTAVAAAKAEQERLVELFLDGTVSKANADVFNARLGACREELARLEARQQSLLATADTEGFQVADAGAWVRQFTQLGRALENLKDDPESAGAILRSMVERIEPGASPDSWDAHSTLPGSPKCPCGEPLDRARGLEQGAPKRPASKRLRHSGRGVVLPAMVGRPGRPSGAEGGTPGARAIRAPG